MNPLTTYITYNLWANKRLVENINACSADEVRTVGIAPFGSIKDAMRHIIGAQNIWHERALGISPTDFMGFTEGRSMEQLQDQLLDTSQKWIDLVEKHPHVAEESITYKTTHGEPFSQNLADIILHVVNHSTYHRGQIMSALRSIHSGKLLGLDLFVFTR